MHTIKLRLSIPVFILKYALFFAALSGSFHAQNAEHLPKITPAFLLEVQRIAAIVSLAEFPLPRKNLESFLALPPYRDTGGMGGKNIPSRMWWVLSDEEDPVGHYCLDVFYAGAGPGPRGFVITGIDLVFRQRSQSTYPSANFTYRSGADPDAIARERAKMRELKMTPGEFVKYRGEQARRAALTLDSQFPEEPKPEPK